MGPIDLRKMYAKRIDILKRIGKRVKPELAASATFKRDEPKKSLAGMHCVRIQSAPENMPRLWQRLASEAAHRRCL